MKKVSLFIAILLCAKITLAQNSVTNGENKITKEVEMSETESNKDVVRKIYEQAMNLRNMRLLGDLISDEFVGFLGAKGAVAFQDRVTELIKALPDAQWKIEELIAEGDRVVVRWKLKGTHLGPFLFFRPTERQVTNEGIGFYRLKNGKVTEAVVHTDRLGFLQDIEALPSDLSRLSNNANAGHVRFIDKFTMPVEAKREFMERMHINMDIIKKLPGFIDHTIYERVDDIGKFEVITIAVWESEIALKKAKENVQLAYKQQGFDMARFFERLNISMERGEYTEVVHP